ncbi:MAG: SDR family oxidoreductase [Chloroflexi bacterium]|nr:MAG: SDR family oxidoreductase [Chloroflexota bacterium]
MKLKDKIAIVTGATKGIGVAIAQEYVKEGAKVVCTGRTVELGQKVVDDIRATGGDAIFVRCDVSKKADVDHVVAETVKTYGTVDIVVNNAGVNHSADFFEITEEDWDWVMSVDLKGTFLMSQAAARVMVEQDKPGVIVNIGSVMAILALGDQIPYCAAKGAVNQLTKAMGLSLIGRGIRVNCVSPGPVLTELMERVVHNEEKHKQLMDRLPIGYIASCEEIARVCVFMASDDSSYFVGQSIYPDGGRSIQAFPSRLEKRS